MAKEVEFEFVVDVPPDRETIEKSHRIIAESYVKRYGAENMKKVLKILENKQ